MTHLRTENIPGIGEVVVVSPQLSEAHRARLAHTALEQDTNGRIAPEARLLAEEVLPHTVSEPHPTTGEPVIILPIEGLPRPTRYVIADAINWHVSPTITIDRNFSQ